MGNLQRLLPRHRQVMKCLLDETMDRKDICRKFKCTNPTISAWLKDPKFSAEFARLKALKDGVTKDQQISTLATARARLEGLADRAVDKVGELIDSASERVALAAAEAVLDRTLPRQVNTGKNGVPPGITINVELMQMVRAIAVEAGIAVADQQPVLQGAAA